MGTWILSAGAFSVGRQPGVGGAWRMGADQGSISAPSATDPHVQAEQRPASGRASAMNGSVALNTASTVSSTSSSARRAATTRPGLR
jgi:hypothetical protein